MRLYQEYFNRHAITDVPVAHHCHSSSLILHTDSLVWKNRIILVSIRWEHHEYHPGQYKISINHPIHDGYKNDTFFRLTELHVKKWHQYEDFILNWAFNLKAAKPVTGKYETILAAWEMFVFSHDSWFLKQPAELKSILFNVLDKENSINIRYQNYQDVIVFLSTHHPAVLRVWKYEVLARIQNDYADWLAAIINNR